jgi:hypothetical protein
MPRALRELLPGVRKAVSPLIDKCDRGQICRRIRPDRYYSIAILAVDMPRDFRELPTGVRRAKPQIDEWSHGQIRRRI